MKRISSAVLSLLLCGNMVSSVVLAESDTDTDGTEESMTEVDGTEVSETEENTEGFNDTQENAEEVTLETDLAEESESEENTASDSAIEMDSSESEDIADAVKESEVPEETPLESEEDPEQEQKEQSEPVQTLITVVFDRNADDAVGTMENQMFEAGVEQTLLFNEYERNGYIFDGWEADVNGTAVHYEDGAVIILESSDETELTFSAVWEISDLLPEETEEDAEVLQAGEILSGDSADTAVEASSQITVEMYRMYNPNSGEHFYTGNPAERNHLVSLGWNYEGVGFTAPTSSNTPMYRLYNPNAGDHHYTSSMNERDHLVYVGWNYEGIGWYADDNKEVAQYRLYNPNATGAGSHHYTSNIAERNYLISIGWKDEGIGFYSVKGNETATVTTVTDTIPVRSVTEEPVPNESSYNDSTNTPPYGYFVASSGSGTKFHDPDCPSAKKIIAAGYAVYYKTAEDAIKAGYEPCSVCKPR